MEEATSVENMTFSVGRSFLQSIKLSSPQIIGSLKSVGNVCWYMMDTPENFFYKDDPNEHWGWIFFSVSDFTMPV